MTKREAIFLGVGALAFPAAYELTLRLLGRHILDPSYRKEK